MVKSVFANVKPSILEWARVSSGILLQEAAISMNKTIETLSNWENGSSSPTIPQLRELAILYKRPLSVFYLQEIPAKFQVISDFRRTPENRSRQFSPELTQEIRFAHQRRELAKELLEDISDEVTPFTFRLNMSINPEKAADMVRDFFGYSNVSLGYKSDPTGRTGFKNWRQSIETKGALVFQTTRIPSDEASGFALAYDELPTIVINRKDAPVRRLFSMIHELAHLALRKSGVSEFDVESARPPEDAQLEVFCNRIAASVLMPQQIFLAENLITKHSNDANWSDGDIKSLANRYNVSKETVLLRLLSFEKTTKEFYLIKKKQYQEEYEQKKSELGPTKKIEMKRNMPQEALSNFGETFIGIVMQNYYQERLTLSEVSGYLGLRTQHVEKLQHKLGAN